MDRRGFTFIEIVVVLAIVGVIAQVTYPQISKIQSRYAVRGAVASFMSAYSMARAAAVRQSGGVELHINVTDDAFWVEVDTATVGVSTMDTLGFVLNLADSRIDLKSTQSLLCFDGRGFPSAAAGCAPGAALVAFESLSGQAADTIRITALGKILR